MVRFGEVKFIDR